MKEKKVKGREKGQTKAISIIKDQIIEPYEIYIQEDQFVLRDSKKNKDLYYFTNLGTLISKLSIMIIKDKRETYTLNKFIKDYNQIKSELITHFKIT